MRWHIVRNVVLALGLGAFASPLGGCALVDAGLQAACRAVVSEELLTQCASLSTVQPILVKD